MNFLQKKETRERFAKFATWSIRRELRRSFASNFLRACNLEKLNEKWKQKLFFFLPLQWPARFACCLPSSSHSRKCKAELKLTQTTMKRDFSFDDIDLIWLSPIDMINFYLTKLFSRSFLTFPNRKFPFLHNFLIFSL